MRQDELALTREAWQEWSAKLRATVTEATLQIDASIPLAQAHVLNAAPARLLDTDLSRMTIGRWSQVVAAAIDGKVSGESQAQRSGLLEVPLWVLAPALFHLGLGAQAMRLPKLLRQRRFGSEKIAEVQVWLEDVPTPTDRRISALILEGSKGSPAGDWSPSPSHGAVLASCNKAKTRNLLLQLLKPEDPQTPSFVFMAAPRSEWPDELLKLWSGYERWVFYLDSTPSSDFRSLRSPTSLERAIKLARRLSSSPG